MPNTIRRHRLVWTALLTQLLAILIGFLILYACASGGIPPRNLSETAYWGTIGILGFMFLGMALPLTIFVVMVMLVLFVCGSSWTKVRFLSAIAFFLWGVYWILLAHTICAPPPD
jgi:hypothetical protein